MNELLALLFNFKKFKTVINLIKFPTQFKVLLKKPLQYLKNQPLSRIIKNLPAQPKQQLLKAINETPILNVLSNFWQKLSPEIKAKFKNQTNFETFLKRFNGENDKIPGTTDEDLLKLENGEIKTDNSLLKPFNEWVPVISSAVKKSMFIPIDRYLKSNDVQGWVKIVFLTSAKVYDYWDVSVKYLDWLRAVNTLGPVDGHGFWSLYLNLTTHRRLGKNNRGKLTKSSIESQYKKTQALFSRKTTTKYKKYSYVKRIPKLRMR